MATEEFPNPSMQIVLMMMCYIEPELSETRKIQRYLSLKSESESE